MASFAKIGLNSKVIGIVSVHNETITDANGNEQENLGISYLTELTHWPIWKQTSYNTYSGIHKLGNTPFRKNFATIGGKYDEDRDAFIPAKPYDSWTLNETTCQWEPPTEMPTDGHYVWNEETQQWDIDNS